MRVRVEAGVITVPHAGLPAGEVVDGLLGTGRSWRLVDVSVSDDAYWQLWWSMWADRRDITVVEHDIVIAGEVLASFEACPADWCAAPYPYCRGYVYHGLGCVRVRASLIGRHPDLWEVIGGMADEKHPARHWCRLDLWMQQELGRRGERMCREHPMVGHLMSDPARPAHRCMD